MNRIYTVALMALLVTQSSIIFGEDEQQKEVKRTVAAGLVALEQQELQDMEEIAEILEGVTVEEGEDQ